MDKLESPIHRTNTIFKVNSIGVLEQLNLDTGEISPVTTRHSSTGEQLSEYNSKYQFYFEVGEAIANLIREGKTLEDIAQINGMPSVGVILHWRRHNKEFNNLCRQAFRERAELYHDKAVRELEDMQEIISGAMIDPERAAVLKEAIDVAKFRFNSLIKLAEKGDPDRFTAKPNPTTINAPKMIVVNTGLPSKRVGDRGEDSGMGSTAMASLESGDASMSIAIPITHNAATTTLNTTIGGISTEEYDEGLLDEYKEPIC